MKRLPCWLALKTGYDRNKPTEQSEAFCGWAFRVLQFELRLSCYFSKNVVLYLSFGNDYCLTKYIGLITKVCLSTLVVNLNVLSPNIWFRFRWLSINNSPTFLRSKFYIRPYMRARFSLFIEEVWKCFLTGYGTTFYGMYLSGNIARLFLCNRVYMNGRCWKLIQQTYWKLFEL